MYDFCNRRGKNVYLICILQKKSTNKSFKLNKIKNLFMKFKIRIHNAVRCT